MADGSITIGTKIDQTGFKSGRKQIESGLSGIKSSLMGLAASVGVAFGVGAIINFGKQSVEATTALTNAMTGLKSVMDGQGRSFSEANAFIQDYISDGLIPATQAITAYKNLANRKYTDTQIQQVLLALKDSAAYGRQASYSLGEAVQSATEGLKNENSILVDNAGVTKNVAKMWEDYAKSIGTTSANLTQQQKIQAEVNGILEESKYQAGDAAKVASSYSGQLLQLKFSFNNLKVAIGNAIIPIAQAALPGINAIITGLTKVANLFAHVTTAIFGKQAAQQDSLASSALDAASATTDLADATTAADKAAKKAIASFDELNVRADKIGSSEVGTVSKTNTVNTPTVRDETTGGIQSISEEIQKFIDPLKNINFNSTVEAFNRLRKSLEPITKTLFGGLEWAYFNIFVPLSKWTIEQALPRFLDTLAISARLLGKILDEYIETYKVWYNSFLKPVAEYTGQKFLEFWGKVNKKISAFVDMISKSEAFRDFRNVLEKIGPPLTEIAKALINIQFILSDSALNTAFSIITNWFKNLEDKIGLVAAILNGDFKDAWGHLKDLLIDNKIDLVKGLFDNLKTSIKDTALQIVDWQTKWNTAIKDMISNWKANISGWWEKDVAPWFTVERWNSVFYNIGVSLGQSIANLAKTWNTDIPNWWNNDVKPWFTFEKWSGLFSNIGMGLSNRVTAFRTDWSAKMADWWNNDVAPWFTIERWKQLGSNIKEGIISGFKSAVYGVVGILNSIIGVFEGLINGVIGGINKMIIGYNSVPLSPDVDPVKPIEIKPIQPPKLATGAVIPPGAEFLATLGDQKVGRNLEAPESLIRQIVREESGNGTDNAGIISAIQTLTRVLSEKKLIDSPEKFARDYRQYFDAEGKRAGTFAAVGGVR